MNERQRRAASCANLAIRLAAAGSLRLAREIEALGLDIYHRKEEPPVYRPTGPAREYRGYFFGSQARPYDEA